MEDELINRLVESIEMGKGDPGFREIFHETMLSSCQNDHTGLMKTVCAFQSQPKCNFPFG